MIRPRCDHRRVKRLFLLLTLVACSKPDDVPTLHDDAESLIKYYKPRLDAETTRIQHVLQLSGNVPKDLPGSDEALRALVDARDKLVEMRKIEKDVEKALASNPNREALDRLVEDEERNYEEGLTFVNENINEVDSWVANQLRGVPATAAPATAPKDVPVPEGAIP